MDIDLNKLVRKALRELQEDRFLNLINLVMSIISSKKKIQIEEIIFEAKLNGYSEDEVYKAIEKLKRDRLIDELPNGFIEII